MNIEEFITGIITRLNTLGAKTFSPELPTVDDYDEDMALAVTLLGGKGQNSLGATRLYNTILFRVIIRGARDNDTETRELADSVYNKLNMAHAIALTDSRIEIIYADSDIQYIEKDENERILYNINFRAIIE